MAINYDDTSTRGVGSIREGMTPHAERVGRELVDVFNRYADRDPDGRDTYDFLVGVAFAVATLALQMPPNARWMFFQMITEQGKRLEHARTSPIDVFNTPIGQS